MSKSAKDIARNLMQINAIKLSPQKPFTWASGIKSPIYCDNRLTLSYPEIRTEIIDAFTEVCKDLDFDIIGGIATAGIPHGALLADRLKKPYLYVRSKAKAHGRQNMIEGRLTEGSKVLLVEDLISTGMSSLKAVDAVRNAGGQVDTVLSIFNYGFQRAVDAFEAKNCTFVSLSNYDILLEQAVENGYLESDQLAQLSKWKEDPENWINN